MFVYKIFPVHDIITSASEKTNDCIVSPEKVCQGCQLCYFVGAVTLSKWFYDMLVKFKILVLRKFNEHFHSQNTVI